MKVLYVEDNEINRLIVVKLLEGLVEIEAVENGYLALERGNTNSYDLFMIDLNLNDPGMDGFDVLRELKRKEHLSNSQFIAVTAFSGEEWREKCLKAGFDEFYTKPIDPVEVLNAHMPHEHH